MRAALAAILTVGAAAILVFVAGGHGSGSSPQAGSSIIREAAPGPDRGRNRAQLRALMDKEGLRGTVETYTSKMDGRKRPYALCATDKSGEPKPLLVVVNPGAATNPLSEAEFVFTAEEFALHAKRSGRSCIVIRPTGRGPGSLYQNYGEVDALEAIEDAASRYPVDRDRISVIGHSMGGAATWYLLSHYPDLFSAGAPMAGYCDYRLWEKPGGHSFPMQPWEEASWQARSAAFLAENLKQSPLWILHGEWDRGVGSGVSVLHSRRMKRLLMDLGCEVKYTEVSKAGHHFSTPELMQEVVGWLLSRKKERNPREIGFGTFWLRHNRSHWLAIEQLNSYGEKGRIRASIQADDSVRISTQNVRAFSIGPVSDGGSRRVQVDGRAIGEFDLGRPHTLRAAGGGWKAGPPALPGEKTHGASGPLSDLFFGDVVLVQGTIGTEAETYFNGMALHNTRALFRETNGGLHRGGIRGENTVDLAYARDVDLTDEEVGRHNLLLFGTDKTNRVIAMFRQQLPVRFEPVGVRLHGRLFRGANAAVFAIFPHPGNPARYVAVHGGVSEDAVTYGSHLNLLLLPDYIVYDGGQALAWGFWDNAWKFPAR